MNSDFNMMPTEDAELPEIIDCDEVIAFIRERFAAEFAGFNDNVVTRGMLALAFSTEELQTGFWTTFAHLFLGDDPLACKWILAQLEHLGVQADCTMSAADFRDTLATFDLILENTVSNSGDDPVALNHDDIDVVHHRARFTGPFGRGMKGDKKKEVPSLADMVARDVAMDSIEYRYLKPFLPSLLDKVGNQLKDKFIGLVKSSGYCADRANFLVRNLQANVDAVDEGVVSKSGLVDIIEKSFEPKACLPDIIDNIAIIVACLRFNHLRGYAFEGPIPATEKKKWRTRKFIEELSELMTMIAVRVPVARSELVQYALWACPDTELYQAMALEAKVVLGSNGSLLLAEMRQIARQLLEASTGATDATVSLVR